MHEKLRQELNRRFADAPRTNNAVELKEELFADLSARYDDLLSQGKTEEEAFRIAVAGIGDVEELLRTLRRDYEEDPERAQKRTRSAIMISVAVGLYILSAIPAIFLAFYGLALMFLMILMIAVATGLLIFNNLSNPRYTRRDDTVVEEFKEWQDHHVQKKHLRGSVYSITWSLAIICYFVVSYLTGAWEATWLIFPLCVAVTQIIVIAMGLKGKKNA